MLKCFHCSKDIADEQKKILISCDGDFVCGPACKRGYEEEKEYFFNEIVHDEKKFEDWMNGA